MATRKLSRSKNNITPQHIVQKLPSHCTLTSKRTVVMCDDWKDGSEPPDKRRKTDENEEELWGDDEEDDVIFSQMVMDSIESSQTVQTVKSGEPNNNNKGVTNKPSSKYSRQDDKGSRFCHPKSVSSDIISQQLKSQGYGTMTHASMSSTVTGSLYPPVGLRKRPTSQVSGDHPKPTLVRESSAMVGSFVQKTSKTDGSLLNTSTLRKVPQTMDAQSKPDFADIMQKKIQKLEEENSFFRQDNQKLKESQYGRDGQIKMLRTKVTQLEAERSRDKQEKLKQKEHQTKQQSEKEKKMESDFEKIKNEMQFKERDIAELQERCRRMEKQSRVGGGDASPGRSQFQSPGKSPRVIRDARSPRHAHLQSTSPRTPQRIGLETGGFPTRTTFMADEKKYSSPMKKDRDKGVQVTDSSLKQLKLTKRRNSMLKTRNKKGGLSGARIASKLLGGTANSPSDPICNIKQSLISLLQSRTTAMDFGVQLERDTSTMNFSTTTGNRSKGYLSNDSGSSRDSVQNPTIQPENIMLAQQGICSLLDSSKPAETDGQPMDITDLHSNSACILVLPLIENYLQNYCEIMQSMNESSSFTSQSTGLSVDTQSVTDSLSSSLKGLILENASCMNSIENQTLCALLVLEKLVTYSPHIRLVLVCEREFEQLIQEGEPVGGSRRGKHPVLTAELGVVSQPDVGVTGEDANKQLLECMENDFHINISDVLLELDSTCVKVLKNCDILCKLMKLANPLEFNNKLGNLHLCEAAVRILTVLAKSSTSSQLERFENVFTQEAATNCVKVYGELSVHQQVSLSSTAIDLITQLSRSPFLLTHLCSQEDECLLFLVYNLCLYLLDLADITHLRPLYHKVYDLMTSILLHHENGGAKLLENNCSCNFEVVRVLSVCLHKELVSYRRSPHPLGLASLCRGFSVLHTLSLRDKLFTRHHAQECKHQYVELVCSFENILKNIPGVEDSELNQVYELWDFDQDYPDSPEDEEMLEEDLQSTPYQTLRPGTLLSSDTTTQGGKLTGLPGPAPSQAIDVVLLDGD